MSYSLGGTVITSHSRVPVPDAIVSVLNGPDANTTTTTDASGHFFFSGLHQSSVIVNVSKKDYFSARAPLDSQQTNQIFLVSLGEPADFTGQVTDVETAAPITGAIVDVNGRYRVTSDALGNYSLTGYLDIGASSIIYAFANGYEASGRYIRGLVSQSFRLHRIEKIAAGDSWSVTIRPDDTLCNNNLQEASFGLPGSGFLCRTVRVAILNDGAITLEAVSVPDGAHPPLEVEAVGGAIPERLENPVSIKVRAGMELIVNVEIPETATASQSFRLTTSIVATN
jgi:Carboxypeptidase regulatory-like domain